MPDSILDILKHNFDGNFEHALETYKIIASPTSLALIEWALEQPKTVHSVCFYAVDDFNVEGIFATEEAARKFVQDTGRPYSYYYDVETWEVLT